MNATPAPAVARLEAIVGAAQMFTVAAELAPYEVDGVRPAAVVRPESAEQVAEVVRFAAAEKLAIIPTGARTKLRIGAPPSRYDLALDMTRLNRVLAYDPGDLTLGVEPGLALAKLTSVLAEHRQFLPLAVPFTDQTTVGGTLAANMDSPLRQGYGPARDYTLGIEFVTGDGTPCKSGGRVVKNVTGYDLHKLLIGSLGTLGVITRVNFRTFPAPPASRGFVAAFPDLRGALEMRRRIADSPLTPITLEILNPLVAQIFSKSTPSAFATLPLPGAWLSPLHWSLAAGFAGNDLVLERYARDLTQMAEQARAISSAVLDDQERPKMWGRLREFVTLMLGSSPAATTLRVSVLPGQFEKLFSSAQQIAERHSLPLAVLARGVGVVYLVLLPAASDAETLSRLAQAATELIHATSGSEIGGRPMIQWCPSELKRDVNVWGPARDDLVLMQRMKKVFDPHGTLAPGRFAGGI